ncbi:16S rRNA (guanine(966)-N(2))-methyltransferase RsmD [Nocardioides sp.]|uniref:16S rRNA (guanine(966)-N(2))-methyltransferase RsmD n=1 Tax=Nocardioides sp. TaxID=35761 RepID=UPI00351688A8
MTRIIAGRAGGRRLATPRGDRTRPTSDRTREALFSALAARAGGLEDTVFLDLFAGSGAVGLEAWSRGAARVRLVEHDRATAALIRRNAASIGCAVADVVAATVSSALARPVDLAVDVAFLDPPYPRTEEEVAEDLRALVPWLAPDAAVLVERSRRSPEPTWPPGLEAVRSKVYGETTVWFAHWYGHAP